MPIYEYRCKSCGKEFEVIQKFDDPVMRKCRDCSGTLEKLISRTAFHLKGGGWYDDGYGAASGGGSKAKSSSAKSDSKGSDTKSSDTKSSDTKKTKTTGSSKKD